MQLEKKVEFRATLGGEAFREPGRMWDRGRTQQDQGTSRPSGSQVVLAGRPRAVTPYGWRMKPGGAAWILISVTSVMRSAQGTACVPTMKEPSVISAWGKGV